jgi:hypothetical protein
MVWGRGLWAQKDRYKEGDVEGKFVIVWEIEHGEDALVKEDILCCVKAPRRLV